MTNFEFDDFDSQVTCEEYYSESGPTDKELEELMSGGDWDNIPIERDEMDTEELVKILTDLGFNVTTWAE